MCRPECTSSSECPLDKVCEKLKCVTPCPTACGLNTDCRVIKHSPICTCRQGYTGDPLSNCYKLPESRPVEIERINPCLPSPCGPNSQCRDIGGVPSCTCLSGFVSSPPFCKPECTTNTDCSNDKACINTKCQDPCQGSCGVNALCKVVNHTPMCSCLEGYQGDPFSLCNIKPPGKDNIHIWYKIQTGCKPDWLP